MGDCWTSGMSKVVHRDAVWEGRPWKRGRFGEKIMSLAGLCQVGDGVRYPSVDVQ